MESYFINPTIEALATAPARERPALIRRIAACVGDEAALRAILGIDPEEFASFYPDMTPPDLSTEDTIDSFIDLFARKQDRKRPEPEPADTAKKPQREPDELIAAPAMDYALMLEESDPDGVTPADAPEAGNDETSDLISSFLQAVPPKTPARRRTEKPDSPKPAEPGDSASSSTTNQSRENDSPLSEELFKLMVKNKNYTKALEIITELSLNNPKKSIYFAYQMRFLKKLIKNQEKGGA